MSAELDALLEEEGIDPLDPAAVGSSDFNVILKRGKDKKDRVEKASEILKTFYSRSGEELRQLKRRLHAAGFYPKGTTLAEIDNSDYDDDSLAAFENAVTRAGAFKESGVRKTLGQVLDTPSERVLAGDGGATGMTPLVKKELVQQVSQKLLGRNVSDAEAAQIAADLPGTVDDATILAEQAIESGPLAAEAGAFDLVQKMNQVMGIGGAITGPSVNAPQPTQGPF